MNWVISGVLLVCSSVFAEIEPELNPTTTTVYTINEDNTSSSTVDGIWNLSEQNTVVLPKCCPFGYAVIKGNCTETNLNFQPNFDVHYHNDTAFDDVPIKPELISFKSYVHNPCSGYKFPMSPDERPKILLNGSLMVVGLGEYDGVLTQEEFCIDNLKDALDPNITDATVYAFVCINEREEFYPQWVFSTYITLITISALLFISSTVFFYRQDVQSIHKKSFMAYALSMSGTYLIIVLMQFVAGGCRFFGLVLQFSMILTFAWLAVLSIDLAWMVHYYRTKENADRFIYYSGSTALFSTIFLIISFINNFTPDIPRSFFKPQFGKNTCSGFDNEQRKALFFVPVVLTVVISIVCLCYSLIRMNHNRYRNTSDGVIQWKKMSGKFRYMYGRLLILFGTMVIWLLDSFGDRFPQTSGISAFILFAQAFQGFIVVPLYTMKSLRKVIDINKKPRIENLQDLMEVSKNYDRRL